MSLQHSVMPHPAGGFITTVVTSNEGSQARLFDAIKVINESAFEPTPVPHSIAAAMLRDGVVPREADEGNTAAPPNCDFGNPYTPTVLAEEVPADDDEGSAAEPARYPPGTACGITGECE